MFFFLQIINKSLQSLHDVSKETKVNLYVVIVVDGDVPKIHNDILDKYTFDIYRRPKNGGVARTKNTSIRLLLEQGDKHGNPMYLIQEEFDDTTTDGDAATTIQTKSVYADNLDLDTEAGFDTATVSDDILDFTERNPFGEVDEGF